MLIFKERQAQNSSGTLTISSVGKCFRAAAYRYHRFPKIPHPAIDPIKRDLIFRVGDALHETFRDSLSNLIDREGSVSIRLQPRNIELRGRYDGLVVDPETGEIRLLEIKTMNPIAYDRWQRTRELEEAYYYQTQLYLHALNDRGITECVFIGIDKGSGEWQHHIYEYEPRTVRHFLAALDEAIRSNPEDAPRRYGPDEKGRLPWQCAYCDYWRHCWPEAEPQGEGGKPQLSVSGNNPERSK